MGKLEFRGLVIDDEIDEDFELLIHTECGGPEDALAWINVSEAMDIVDHLIEVFKLSECRKEKDDG